MEITQEKIEMNGNNEEDKETKDKFLANNVYDEDEQRIKEKLNEHFEGTCTRTCDSKNSCFNRWPKKLTLLILKFFFVTAQLCMFGRDRADFAKYLERNNIAMKHLLLKDWKAEYETMPYPPATGIYALYTIEELLEHINFTVIKMHEIPTTAVGSFFISNSSDMDRPIEMCMAYFNKGIFDMDGTIELDPTVTSECRNIGIDSPEEFGFSPSLLELIQSNQKILVRLLKVTLGFKIDSVHVNMRRQKRSLKCFRIHGLITFDNFDINGQIPVTLDTDIDEVPCTRGDYTENADPQAWFLACVVITLCCVCIGFSAVTIHKSIKLTWATERFLVQRKKCSKKSGEDNQRTLSCRAVNEIMKYKDVLIVFSDLLTIAGSILKLVINNKSLSSSSRVNDACGILLGLGCMLLWLGVLHYLAYDPDFNLLFSVVWKSAGKVLRFVLCVGMLYISFTLCGWVVLGPYHLKFSDISSSLMCLMALINGDEIYVSYTAVHSEKRLIWWFNFFFITTYVVIFTLITINIFIAIFNSAYELLHQNRKKEKNKDVLLEFLGINDLDDIDQLKSCKSMDDTRCCCACFSSPED